MLDQLTQLLSSFIANLPHSTGNGAREQCVGSVFRFHDLALSDCEIPEADGGDNDPLDCLDDVITPTFPSTSIAIDQKDDFQQVLDDLTGSLRRRRKW